MRPESADVRASGSVSTNGAESDRYTQHADAADAARHASTPRRTEANGAAALPLPLSLPRNASAWKAAPLRRPLRSFGPRRRRRRCAAGRVALHRARSSSASKTGRCLGCPIRGGPVE